MKTLFITLFVIISTTQFSIAQQHYTKGTPLPCLNKKFTIVAHIVKDTMGLTNITEADILTAIDTLNYYFEPICASFEICEFRIIDNYQYDNPKNPNEWEQMQVKFHQENRINIFFVNSLLWSSDPCGFGTPLGIQMLDRGGILMIKGCIPAVQKGLTHEMGHYFGLEDTNRGEGIEHVNGDNCETEGDEICDTPSDPYVNGTDILQYIDPLNCRFIYPGVDENGDFYRTHTSNIMSMYPEVCKCGFTHEQFLKMAGSYLEVVGMW